jgi:putative membrane protein
MKPVLWASVAAAVLTLACGRDARNDTVNPADNDSAIGTSGVARGDISSGDRDFVSELLDVNTAEVQLGTMASERGASADVKQFGQMMVQDHTRAGEELQQIASRHQIPRPGAALDEKHRDLIDRLSKLRGAEFDREYIDAMVQGHQDVIDKLQARVDERDRLAVATGQAERNTSVKPEDAGNRVEASLNAWAAETLPAVKKHLERAKAIDDKLDRSKAGS